MSAVSALVRPYRMRLAASGALGIAAAVLELTPAAGIYLAAQSVYSPSPDAWSVLSIAAVVFVLILLRYVLYGSSLIVSHAAAFSLQTRLRAQLAEKLGRVPRSFFDGRSPGSLKKALVDDVDALEATFAHHVPDAASGAVTPLIAFIVLLFVDWRLALVSLSLVPLGIAAMSLAMRNFDTMMEQWHSAERRANEVVLELLRGIVVLKAYGRDATEMKRVREGVFGVRDFAEGINKRSAPAYTLFMLMLSSNLVVVLPVGVAFYQAGEIGKPVLLLFLALGYGLTAPLMKLMFLFGDMQMNLVRIQRIGTILDADEQEREVTGVSALTAAARVGVVVQSVSFTYDEARGPALEDVTLAIEPGQRVALVGPSGAGKSTLAQLISAAREPGAGEVALLVDGERRSPRGAVSFVGQEAQLFFGTVRENLLMARPNASDEQLAAAAQAAGLQEVLARLPKGLDTQIGERGAHLSGGEAQRVTVARALLRDAPVVVLDEVTSHLDPENERAVQRGVDALAVGRTLVIIAHRLRTIIGADVIAVLDGGRLVDKGTHDELRRRCAVYERMWSAQQAAAGWTLGKPRVEEKAS